MTRRSLLGVTLPQNKCRASPNVRQPVANTKLTELLRCTSTFLQNHTSSLLPLSSLFDMFWRMSLHPEQADEHPRHPQHDILQPVYYRCISQYQEMIEGTAKVSLVSIFLHKAPNPNPQPAKYSLPLLDLIEDSDAVVFRCCTLWWQHVGVDGLFRS